VKALTTAGSPRAYEASLSLQCQSTSKLKVTVGRLVSKERPAISGSHLYRAPLRQGSTALAGRSAATDELDRSLSFRAPDKWTGRRWALKIERREGGGGQRVSLRTATRRALRLSQPLKWCCSDHAGPTQGRFFSSRGRYSIAGSPAAEENQTFPSHLNHLALLPVHGDLRYFLAFGPPPADS
jgi:hypothetical protein